MAFITCENVSFAYDHTRVVSGLHFDVKSGDYLCVIGENGSGKSTLIKGLLRLIPPVTGTITRGEGLRSGEIGYLPQQTAAQKDFPANAYEVVLSGRQSQRGFRPFYSRADKKAVDENMERLHIKELKNICYRELSGGQQQRVLLARALCATRKMLLLDEPAAGLDPLAKQDLYTLINQLNRDTGITMIMISHDVHSVVQYASHILHLKNTQLFFGTAKDYKGSEVGRRYMHAGDDTP